MAPKRETAQELWGKELARAIDAAGMNGRQLADAINVAPSTVSQWINGKRSPHTDDARRIDQALSTNGYLTRQLEEWVTREVAHEWLDKWMTVELEASSLLSFQTTVIPGLLQTEDYATAVLKAGEQPPKNIDEKVRIRLKRQKEVLEENPPQIIAVLDESCILRPIGGPKVMAEQLRHLVELSKRDEVIIQIVLMDKGAYSGLNGPLVIASVNGREIAYLDNSLWGEVVENPGQVANARRKWESLRSKALDEEASIQLITEVAKNYEDLA